MAGDAGWSEVEGVGRHPRLGRVLTGGADGAVLDAGARRLGSRTRVGRRS